MSQTNSQNAPLAAALKAFDRAWAGQELTPMAIANRAALSGETIITRAANAVRDLDAERETVDAAIDAAPMKTPGQRENLDTFVAAVTEIETARAALAAVAAPEAKLTAKKPLKKAAAAKPEKTPTKATPTKKTTGKPAPATKTPAALKTEVNGEAKTPRAKKDGLRGPQVRILAILSKSAEPMSRKQIVEASATDGHGTTLDTAWMATWIGPTDPERRAASDAKYFPSLLTLGLVTFGKPSSPDTEDRAAVVYKITAAGKKAYEAAKKAAK